MRIDLPASYEVATTRQRGLSLVELMVAMLVSLLLLAAVATLVVNSSRAHREVSEAARQLENGRYAMQLLNDEIHHAGYYGQFYNLDSPPTSLPDPCETDPANLEDALPLPLQGYDAPATPPVPLSNCLADANHVDGTDIVVLRRAATVPTAAGSLEDGDVYLQSTPVGFVLDTGANGAAFTLTKKDGAMLADIRKYRTDTYYLSPCHVPATVDGDCDANADAGDPVPTLKRLTITSNGSGTTVVRRVPLVAGVENLQLDYGLDDDDDGIPDRYVTVPADTAEWADVITVEVHLLARNIAATAGYSDTKSYDMGLAGAFAPADTGYKRHVFTALVRATNPASRREIP